MTKITKRTVEAVQPGTKDIVVWDGELRGFGLRVKPSGARSYVVQYRNAHGRSKRVTIGAHGPLTAEEARQRARRMLADVTKGSDPAGDRAEARKAPTVADLAQRYLDEYLPERGKARSIAESRRLADRHILPALGRRKVADVTRADVSKLHHDLRATPTQANRVHSLLRRLMNMAEKWGMRPGHKLRALVRRRLHRPVLPHHRRRQGGKGRGAAPGPAPQQDRAVADG